MSLDYIDPSTPPPVDWHGPIFPEPILYRLAPLWLFLLVLAVLMLMFYRQRLMDARGEGRRAPAIIFGEIRKAIDQALRTTGPATIPAGQRVIETVRLYLGPVLDFSSDFKASFGKLEKAVAGRSEHAEHTNGHHRGGEHQPCAPAASASGCGDGIGAADRVVQVVQVVTAGQVCAVTPAPRQGAPDQHDPAMSTQEQTAAVRYALERLHEFWTPNTVEPQLRAMREALSIREPKGPHSGFAPARRAPVERRRRPPPPVARPRI